MTGCFARKRTESGEDVIPKNTAPKSVFCAKKSAVKRALGIGFTADRIKAP